MVSLLARWLIKNHTDYASAKVRVSYGVLCGAVGIGFNVLLFFGKLLAGMLSGSIGVTADAFNNLSDAAGSVVTLIGFRVSDRKADYEHPFGHGRAEYVAALTVAMAIVLMGIELIRTSVERILTPTAVTFSWLTAGILIASILVKCYMFFYNRRIGRRIGSAAMRAAALDSISDVAATSVVLLTAIAGQYTAIPVDGWAGLLVAGFILWSGISAAKGAISPLLGEKPDRAYVERIEKLVTDHPDVLGVHDIVVHDYGPGRRMVSLHAEVPADGDFITLHDTVDNVEKELREALECHAIIHMDPVQVGDEETNRMRETVDGIAKAVDARLSIHDFRLVPGKTHVKLVFDVVVPYGMPMSDEAVCGRIRDGITALDGSYFAVIDVDKDFVR